MKSDFDIRQDRINFKIILNLVFKLKRKLLNLILINFSTLNSNFFFKFQILIFKFFFNSEFLIRAMKPQHLSPFEVEFKRYI